MKNLNLKRPITLLLLFFILLTSSCGRTSTHSLEVSKKVPCEECSVVPSSGNLKDLRYGFYYDQETKKCTRIEYSSGGTAAPFQTMEECITCCASKKKD